MPLDERYADILLGALDVRNEAINHHQFKKRVSPNEIKGETHFLFIRFRPVSPHVKH